jgi:thiaminase
MLVALLACFSGYREVEFWLKEAVKIGSWVVIENKLWIDDYSGGHYQQAVNLGLGM